MYIFLRYNATDAMHRIRVTLLAIWLPLLTIRADATEVRAVWIVRDQIKSRAGIRAVVAMMRDYGLTTAIVQVRGRADAYYRSRLVVPAPGIEADLDPLAEFLREARPHGIEVQAWVNVFLAADSSTREYAHPDHISATRPGWFLMDGEGRSMLRYSRAERRRAGVEGAFLDPALPVVRQYNLEIIREILDHYPVAGIHLDYIRYPTSRPGSRDFGVASALRSASVKEADRAASAEIRSRFVSRMVRDIHRLRNHYSVKLTAAVWPNRAKMKDEIFQNWPYWVEKGWIDHAYVMTYYNRKELFDSRMQELAQPRLERKMVIGVGLYLKPGPEMTWYQLQHARQRRMAGISYFDARFFLDPANRDLLQGHNFSEKFGLSLRPTGEKKETQD
ncbi:MAG: family 10 glycosylhydrolase [Spirochaetales bacterium]|nr:family 10 glycosylhydrolase [Spirochaetales bacterium]